MSPVLVAIEQLRDRLGREEQHLRQLGLHAQAQGIRSAITILIRHTQELNQLPPSPPSLDPST